MNSLDNPETTISRKSRIEEKKILKKIYEQWYGKVLSSISAHANNILELGTGAGFLQEFSEKFDTSLQNSLNIITSDVMYIPSLNVILDGQSIPIEDNSLDGIVMINVFHHIPNSVSFLNEAMRVLKKNGRIVMVEPWMNIWSRFFYKHFHHEITDITCENWIVESFGPLSSSNQALPWIVFQRDKKKFSQVFPQLSINRIEPFMPFNYILSGGFSGNWNLPILFYHLSNFVENCFSLNKYFGLFALIELEIKRK